MDYLIVQLMQSEAVFARFRKQKGTISLVTASRHDIAGDDALDALLAETATAVNEEVRTVLSISPHSLFMREMELPIHDRRKVREVLPLELAGETALDSSEMIFDAVPLAAGKTLATWGKQRKLAEQIALLAGQRLEPEIVTASLFHWKSLLAGSERGTIALTDGDALAVYQEGEPVYFRALDAGGASTVQKTLALLELGKGITVDRVFYFGGAVRNESFRSAATDKPPFRPLLIDGSLAGAFAGEDDARDLAAVYAVAQACAFGDPVNFRSGTLAYTAGHARTRKKLRLTMALAAALVLLLFGETGLRYFFVKRDIDSLNASIGSIYREVFPGRKKPTDAVAELRAEIKRLGGGAAAGTTLATLKKLAEIKGDDIIGVFEAEIDKGEVRLKGDARSIQAVNDFKAKAAALFPVVEVGEIKSRPDGGVSFVLRGTSKENAK